MRQSAKWSGAIGASGSRLARTIPQPTPGKRQEKTTTRKEYQGLSAHHHSISRESKYGKLRQCVSRVCEKSAGPTGSAGGRRWDGRDARAPRTFHRPSICQCVIGPCRSQSLRERQGPMTFMTRYERSLPSRFSAPSFRLPMPSLACPLACWPSPCAWRSRLPVRPPSPSLALPTS